MTATVSDAAGPVGVGVLGCAEIARRRLLPAMAAEPGLVPTAVASRDPATAARVAAEFDCVPVTGYDRLLERPDVEAVYIPLPAALHADWAERALRAGKHVLVEKPLTTGAPRTAELVELARSLGLVLRENFMFLHHSRHDRVLALVVDGTVGRPHSVSATFSIPAPPRQDIRHRADLGGGALLDVGVYPLRVAQFLLGPHLEVLGAHLGMGQAGVDVSGAALLRSADNVTAHLRFGMDHAYTNAYEICGSKGRILVERAFTPPADARTVIRVERRDGVHGLELEPEDQYANSVRAFAAAVRTGQPRAEGDRSNALAVLVDDVRRSGSR